jgi:hypothetical protein
MKASDVLTGLPDATHAPLTDATIGLYTVAVRPIRRRAARVITHEASVVDSRATELRGRC